MSKAKSPASNVVQFNPVPDWMNHPCVWQASGDNPEPVGEPQKKQGALRRWMRRFLDALIADLNRLREKL